ncbi:DUF1573 domain-containing protein [Schlesneria paludicola]|uniref:DUF1573 domain-containing protein n=1 Tax=Schlesneria paludicola TaxID=360056 RepID=UPI0004926D53
MKPFVILLLLSLLTAGCSQNQVSDTIAANHGASSRQTSDKSPLKLAVDLGVVFQGEETRYKHWIKNQSDRAVTVHKLNTSCECLTANLSHTQFAAHDRAMVSLTYDGNREPEFTGSLAVSVELHDSEGGRLGEITASIEVTKRPTDE